MTGEPVVPVLRVCEDCGGEVESGVAPLGLFRPVPHSPVGRGKGSRRKRRRGGRRWREYQLCRRCRGEALRRRAMSGSVMENGVRRVLRTTERLPPKKGGRPRLLTDEQLRAAHVIYDKGGLCMREIADQLSTSGVVGTKAGLASALLLGWRRLELPVRTRALSVALARGTDGTASKPQKKRCKGRVKHGARRGERCQLWAMKGAKYCYDHSEEKAA